ncbi:MAG: hypothetical protein WAK40_01030 [Thermoplasmata archaeon]
MANCKDVYAFLTGVQNRSVTTSIPDPDLATLAELGILKVVAADQYAQMARDLDTMATGRVAIGQEMDERNRLAETVQGDQARTHSILFHFEGKEHRQSDADRAAKDVASLQAMQSDLTARQQQFDTLLSEKATMDLLTPYSGRYVGLTGFGAVQVRDLGVRLYRSSDDEFSAYWQGAQAVDHELNDIGDRSSAYFAQLGPRLPPEDRSYVWAIAVGLAKSQNDLGQGVNSFLSAYGAIGGLAHNDENRLLSAEILAAIPRPLSDTVPLLGQLEGEVRKLGVPKESALGVASLMLLGQRQDGSFAMGPLQQFLRLTPSFESAALLAIVNRPIDELTGKFNALRTLFRSWGYQPSEDIELASSYLTLSDLPADGISTKLTILSRGLIAYLEYPLVASAILASIPVLEANETLNLLEHAYEIIGRRAMPMSQAELLCLAVRMVHGIRSETVSGLDATAAKGPAGFSYSPTQRFFFVPIFVLHGSYYSTFGFGGAHPAHVGAFGGSVG